MLQTAIRAAKKAAVISRKYYRKIKRVKYKDHVTNLVTKVDYLSEKTIVKEILKKYPSHGIITEEVESRESDSEFRWIIDPLDGTVNYAHGFPLYCISIALQKNEETMIGVVFAPVLNELFVAIKGKGAYLNGKRISVSKKNNLRKAFLVTGFSYTVHFRRGNEFKHFEKFCTKSQAVRRGGSAALDLCYVACGIFDGFWEKGLYPWDTAAGVLMIEEAGGKVSDYCGKEFDMFKDEITASNGRIHKKMVKITRG